MPLRQIVYLSLVAMSSTVWAADGTDTSIETILVTANRTAESGATLGQAWSALSADDVAAVDLQHSNQLFNRVSGAWVSRGNGQESLVSLRSPVLTGAGACGAFFTAEDGINLRAPGFCNVNQLFDANLLQAAGVEVVKGPANATYGSNAVNGVINVLTKSAEQTQDAVGIQLGSRDFGRARVSLSNGGVALNANATTYGGYQAESGYDQQKANLRFDGEIAEWQLTGVVSASNLNQETAGYIQDGKGAYRSSAARKVNRNPEAYRDARSLRAHLRFERDFGDRTVSLTPYFRSNEMEFLQHYLPWKSREINEHDSVGFQAHLKAKASWGDYITGIELDSTDGRLKQDQAQPFSPNQPAGIHYDYQVDATNIAFFGQLEVALADDLLLQAGLRSERTEYDYTTQETAGSACAPEASACRFYRPEDRSDDFSNLSSNLALVWTRGNHNFYVRTAQGFRAPQATELYRLQSGQQVADIDSEEATSIDVGWRFSNERVSTDISVYAIDKDEVIFLDRNRQSVSGASTRHRGIDLDLSWTISETLTASVNAAYADHTYDSDIQILGSQDSIQGNDIDTAPRHFGSARITKAMTLNSRPASIELEATWVDKYYIDPNNQHSYPGHELVNARAEWLLSEKLRSTLTVTNLLDTGYAERADYGFGNYRYFVGEPRSAVLGLYFAL